MGAANSGVSSEELAEVKDVVVSAGGADRAVEPEELAKTPPDGGGAKPFRKTLAGSISALGAQLTAAPIRTTALGETSFAQDHEGARLK